MHRKNCWVNFRIQKTKKKKIRTADFKPPITNFLSFITSLTRFVSGF